MCDVLSDCETAEGNAPPAELKRLGCTPEQYYEEIKWLKQLYKAVVTETPLYNGVYGAGMDYGPKRKLTKVEFKRLLADIKKLHLIVVQTNIGFIEGIAYLFYTNPQANRLARGLPARGSLLGMEAEWVFMLHWGCLKTDLLNTCPAGAKGEALIEPIFKQMEPYSHSELNVKWQKYCRLNSNTGLSSCFY